MTNKDNMPSESIKDKEKQKDSSNKNSNIASNQKSNNKPFWKKHLLSLLLLLGIAIAIIWGLIGQNRLEKEHKAEIEHLISNHNEMLSSLKLEEAQLFTSTLALAVRSELIDENKDQVYQFFKKVTTTNEQISKVMLVNHTNGKIEMSTNIKDESNVFENQNLLKAKDVVSETNSDLIITASPVMGLNSQLALLVVEISK